VRGRWGETIDIFGPDGKVHVLVNEGSEFDVQMYYHLYDPHSATPDVPIERTFIEHQKW
jgi:hypothetical protein